MSEFLIRSSLRDMKPNHRERYLWAIREIKARMETGIVLDACCGIGYGAKMLADEGFIVDCVDRSMEAMTYHGQFFLHDNVNFINSDIYTADIRDKYDAIVSIETIEHLPDDKKWVETMAARTRLIIATVPNQDIIPFDPQQNPWHLRHYTKDQFDALMPGKKTWFTQYGKWEQAEMVPGYDGMTLGVVCEL